MYMYMYVCIHMLHLHVHVHLYLVGASRSVEEAVYEHLFVDNTYHREVRPSIGLNVPLPVNISVDAYFLQQIVSGLILCPVTFLNSCFFTVIPMIKQLFMCRYCSSISLPFNFVF